MRKRDDDLLHTLLLRKTFGIPVELDSGYTRLVVEDLNLLHGRSSTLGFDTERLEDSLLANPSCGKRGWWGRLGLTVGDLSIGEVTGNEVRVVGRNGRDEF